jgi:hypothetical protein
MTEDPLTESRARKIGTHIVTTYGLHPNDIHEARLVITPNNQWIEVRLRLTPTALDAAIHEATNGEPRFF